MDSIKKKAGYFLCVLTRCTYKHHLIPHGYISGTAKRFSLVFHDLCQGLEDVLALSGGMTEALYRSHDIISNWKLKFSAYLVHVRFAQRNSNEWAYDDDEQQCGLAHDCHFENGASRSLLSRCEIFWWFDCFLPGFYRATSRGCLRNKESYQLFSLLHIMVERIPCATYW